MNHVTKRIGFIGLGIMGSPMAANLVSAGFGVTGFDLNTEAVKRLEERGGTAAASLAEAVDGADIVITMLPDSPQVEEVVLADGGVLEHMSPGGLLVDMSTIKPETSLAVAEAGRKRDIRVLDAPVSGGEAGAVEAVLSIMVGGAEADFEEASTVFAALGRTVVHVGPHGAGQVVKAANQLLVAGIIALNAEALLLLEAYDIDPARGLDVLNGGLAGSTVLQRKRDNFLTREFDPGFRIDLHHKDMGIAVSAAREGGVSLPLTGHVAQLVAAARSSGLGGRDHSALLSLLERMNGKVAPSCSGGRPPGPPGKAV